VAHLVIEVEEVAREGRFVITDGHAATPLTQQFGTIDALKRIDWQIMRARYWMDTDEDGDRKRRRQAEFLVYDSIPYSAIKLIGVADARAAEQIQAALPTRPTTPEVIIRRDWYY
jgi:hypothetical protein